MFNKAIAVIGAVGMALALAAPAAALPPKLVYQTKSTISILPPSYKAGAHGYWVTGKVTTTKDPGGSKGRYVALFDREDNNIGINYTGSTAGHSAGYYRILAPNLVKFPFQAYVTDRYNWSSRIDEMPASTGQPSLHPDSSTVSILPQRGDGWFTGKVTTKAEGAGQKGRTVILFNSKYQLGTNVTGSTPGHSQGYWQVRATGYAGISVSVFDAYALDRWWPALLMDSLPAQSAVIPY